MEGAAALRECRDKASRVLPTPDGKTYVASYRQQLSDLFLLDGLR